MALSNLAACVSSLGEAASVFGEFDSEALQTAIDYFQAGGEIMQTVANVVIPPPGGQVIGAVLALAYTVLKASKNVVACRQLALKCAEIMKYIVEHRKSIIESRSAALRDDLTKFMGLTENIQDFCNSLLNEGWAKRMVSWAKTSEDLRGYCTELDDLTKRMDLGVSLDTHAIVQKADQERRMLDDIIDQAGGVDSLLKNPNAVEGLKQKMSGADQALFAAQIDMMSMLKEMSVNNKKGLHDLIKNTILKSVWADFGNSCETMSWEIFLQCFPDGMTAPDDVKLEIKKELADKVEVECFKSAVEDGDWDNLSIPEVNKAFPMDGSEALVTQVKYLKASFRDKCMSVRELGREPDLLSSRDTEVHQIVEHLHSGQRILMVTGGPGEGKVAVSIKAAYEWQRQYNVEGAAFLCNLSKADSTENLESCLTHALCQVVKAGPNSAKLASKLSQLAALDRPVLMLLTHCEGLEASGAENEAILKAFQNHLNEMLSKVKKMQIIATSRKLFALGELPHQVKEIKLQNFSLDSAVALLQHQVPSLSKEDATMVAKKFSYNPQLVSVVAGLLLKNVTNVSELAEESDGLGWLHQNQDEDDIGKEHASLLQSVSRSIKLLGTERANSLLKLTVFPEDFSVKCVQQILGIKQKGRADRLLLGLLNNSLLHKSNSGIVSGSAEDRYIVTPLVRDYARYMLSDGKKTAARALNRTASSMDNDLKMGEVRTKFVKYSSQLALDAFSQYIEAPMTTFNEMALNKMNIQEALAMGSELAVMCKDAYLDLLPKLYYVNVYSNKDVQEACRKLAEEYHSAGEEVAEGVCLAVGALFNLSGEKESYEASQAMAVKAKEKLKVGDGGSRGDAKQRLWVAMAMRAEGVALRDLGKYEESVAVHKEGLDVIRDSYMAEELNRQGEMERVILLAEMAGTLDYAGQYEEGHQVAQDAITAAKGLFPADAAHPIMATCLTANGYHMIAKGTACRSSGDMDDAMECFEAAYNMHETAFRYRQTVLGYWNLDTAISLNQMAVALRELGRYDEAEAAFLKSLEIRVSCCKPTDNFISNTHHGLGLVYQLWGKLTGRGEGEDTDEKRCAVTSFSKALEIREEALGKTAKKTLQAARDLVGVLRQVGREEEATAVEQRCGLAAV